MHAKICFCLWHLFLTCEIRADTDSYALAQRWRAAGAQKHARKDNCKCCSNLVKQGFFKIFPTWGMEVKIVHVLPRDGVGAAVWNVLNKSAWPLSESMLVVQQISRLAIPSRYGGFCSYTKFAWSSASANLRLTNSCTGMSWHNLMGSRRCKTGILYWILGFILRCILIHVFKYNERPYIQHKSK